MYFRFAYIVPIIIDDYELAKEWYDVRGMAVECNLLYPYCADLTSELIKAQRKNAKAYNVIVGNSASKTNNHIEAFSRLSKHSENINRLYCPLSYGSNARYINSVLDKGYAFFGGTFTPLLEFFPYEKYMEIITSIDIAYYENNRQEGLGNILSLLNYGKTIYIRSDITSWNFFYRNKIQFIDTQTLETNGLEILDHKTVVQNRMKMRNLFNEEKSLEVWKGIFSMEIK